MAGRGRHSADDKLALGIATGQTVRDAAAAAGVSERTAHRRLRDDPFRLRVRDCRQHLTNEALGRCTAALVEAADTLRGLLSARSEAVRVRAALALLQMATDLKGSDLDERLWRLEDRVFAASAGCGTAEADVAPLTPPGFFPRPMQ